MTQDEADIRNILEERIKGFHARNVDQLMSNSDADIVSFDLAPPLKSNSDRAAARANINAWFGTWKTPISWTNKDLVVNVDGNVAYSTALAHMGGTKTDGTEVSLWVRSTNGFRKVDGRWRHTHLHTSTPFYMDGSFKAAVDLKP